MAVSDNHPQQKTAQENQMLTGVVQHDRLGCEVWNGEKDEVESEHLKLVSQDS